MKYSDTNLGGPSLQKNSCVAVPLSCHPTPCLPTLPYSSTNSTAFPFPPRCFLSLVSSCSPLSLLFPLPTLTLPEDGSVKDKGQTKSQHSCEHLFCIAARSLCCSILRLISLSVSGECHCELLVYDMLQGFQNALVELKIQHMLQTVLCVVMSSKVFTDITAYLLT